MGEMADAILNGDFDSVTGEYLGEGQGFPRTLEDGHHDYYDSKAFRKQKNLDEVDDFKKALVKKGIGFKDNGQIIMFRNSGKPKVDFYPTKGTWTVPAKKAYYRGGWKSFIKWYEKAGE